MKINMVRISNAISKNIPHLLTGVGILWFGISAKCAFDSGVKISKMVGQSENFDDNIKVTPKVIAREVLPAVGAFAVGASCVVMSDVANTRMLRSTEAAYNRLATNFSEYKAAVVGVLGSEANKLASKTATDAYKPEDEPELPEGYSYFYDSFSRNHFIAKFEDVIAAEYYANRRLCEYGFVSVNEFYNELGIPNVDRGDSLGWDVGELADYAGICWLDFENVEHVEDDGSKWYSIHYMYDPTIDGIIDWDAIRNEYHLRGIELFEAKANNGT